MTSVTVRRVVAVACVLLLVPAVAASVGALDTAQSQVEDEGEYGIELEIVSESEGTVMVAMSAHGDDVAGYQANISYDPSVVQFVDATGEDFASPTMNHDNDAGWVFLTASQPEGEIDPTLALLEFEVVGDVDDENLFGFNSDHDIRTTLINDAGQNGNFQEYRMDDGTLETTETSLDVTESTFESNGGTQGANGDDSNGAGDEGTGGTDPGDDDDNGSGMSTLVIGLLAFVGAVVVIGAIAGSYLYGTRQAGGGDAE